MTKAARARYTLKFRWGRSSWLMAAGTMLRRRGYRAGFDLTVYCRLRAKLACVQTQRVIIGKATAKRRSRTTPFGRSVAAPR